MPIRRQKIRNLVEEILQTNRVLDAPVPIRQIVKNFKIQVNFGHLDGDMSGFIYRTGTETIIGVNTNHPRSRQDFTIAHELGHFLLHDQDDLHVDREFRVRLRDMNSSAGIDDAEREANLFAASLLMPDEFIEEDLLNEEFVDLLDDKCIERLTKKYRVSSQAFLNRLKNLGFIRD